MSQYGSRVSIIMPTLNSEKTIKISLESIKNQEYPENLIEILVVDGGSTDKTQEIAKRYGARVLDNPKVQQEYAKHLGLINAKGNLAVFLDSDEVLENKKAIYNRVKVFYDNQEIKMVHSGGYKKPAGHSFINDYINYFSDPFAFFMNGVSTEAALFITSMKRKYKNYADLEEYVEFRFDLQDPLPVVDLCAGNTIDLAYVRSEFKEMFNNPLFIPQVFYLLVRKTGKTAVLKDDVIVHYSADSLKKFVNKIRWRVIVNIHYKDMPGTGFSNREEYQPLRSRLKKYLFIPYSLSVVLPAVVSLYHAVYRKNFSLLIHLPLTVYTGLIIVYFYILKLLGVRPVLKTYGAEEKKLNL
jgi:glycosyltransferase involved in cell wall biosynthesis